MPTLANIEAEIASMLDIPDDELTEEQKNTMQEYLLELGEQEAKKIDDFSMFVKESLARVEFLKQEANRIIEKSRTIENKINYLKQRYIVIMNQHGITKIRGNAYSIYVKKTEKVSILNEESLEERFIRRIEKIEPDKKAIKTAIKSGEIIPGCQLYENQSLVIR